MKAKNEVQIFTCGHIGVAGTTDVHVTKISADEYQARVGIALIGSTNMSEEELEGANPFDDTFHDNYASGNGATVEAAIAAMKLDMNKISDSLWM